MSRSNAPQALGAVVLIVEDDDGCARVAGEFLHERGYQTCHARSGGEAWAMLRAHRADVVLLDLVLPDTDGLLLCSDLRSFLEVPIVVCSATGRRRDALLARRLGADDFLPKPYQLDDLLVRIETVLARGPRVKGPGRRREDDVAHAGGLVIDLVRRHAAVGPNDLDLTPTEYRLLSVLASRVGEAFSMRELVQSGWGFQDESLAGRGSRAHLPSARQARACHA